MVVCIFCWKVMVLIKEYIDVCGGEQLGCLDLLLC